MHQKCMLLRIVASLVIPNCSIFNYSIARIEFLKDPGYPGDSNSNFLKLECPVCVEFLAQKQENTHF